MFILSLLFWVSAFVIAFAMVGYPALLILLEKVIKPQENQRNDEYTPVVTYMIVAHNEEDVIQKKLGNALELEYPADKLHILVASDNSTDDTNAIVERFIQAHPEMNVELYTARERKGKTNAQNEAQKVARGEILVMTDANSMIHKDAIRELVSYFAQDDVVYVCGKLVYSNAQEGGTGTSEAAYWDIDLKMRDIESRIQTITAGNGALYACRNEEYIDIPPIQCHDSAMPLEYGRMGKRCLFNPAAIAVEKTGGSDKDEFKRKVRMSRNILSIGKNFFRTCNVFKYRWFSLFYFGHRVCRNNLWLAHLLAFVTSCVLAAVVGHPWWYFAALVQLLVFVLAWIVYRFEIKQPLVRMVSYYMMTVLAQLMGVKNILTGKAKPFWEVVESTR